MDGFQREAESFVAKMIAGIQPEYRKLSPPVKRLVIEVLHDRMARHLKRPCVIHRERQLRQDVKEALEQISTILSMCDDIPERGEDFAQSVQDQAQDMAAMIEERNFVTSEQKRALDNWESGLAAWVH